MLKLLAAVFLLTSALVTATEQFGSETYDQEVKEPIELLRKNGFDESQIDEIIAEKAAEEARDHEHTAEGVSWRVATGYPECAEEGEEHVHEEEYKPKPLVDVCKENECPDFEVLPSGCGYEARKYLAGKWVGTRIGVENITLITDEKTSAFFRLYLYISGANDQELEIAKTMPVLSKWFRDPAQLYTLTGASMHFYIPKAVAADAPVPTDKTVSVEDWGDTVMYDRAFGGNDESEEIYDHEFKELDKAILKDGKSFHMGTSVIAGYHWGQRKEVMFLAKDQKQGQ